MVVGKGGDGLGDRGSMGISRSGKDCGLERGVEGVTAMRAGGSDIGESGGLGICGSSSARALCKSSGSIGRVLRYSRLA